MSPSAVTRELGLNNSISTAWKHGALPKGNTLQKLADYFGVTVDYLLGIKPLPPKEIAVFNDDVKKIMLFEDEQILEAFYTFMSDIGYSAKLDIVRFGSADNNEKVWILHDNRENVDYLLSSNDLDKLQNSVVSYTKYQIYEMLQKAEKANDINFGNYVDVLDKLD